MRANTDKGEATQMRALKTFKVLRDAASFDEAAAPSPDTLPINSPIPNGASNGQNASGNVHHIRTQTAPDLTINISLQIAATNDASIYDKFFASMKKHLFPNEA